MLCCYHRHLIQGNKILKVYVAPNPGSTGMQVRIPAVSQDVHCKQGAVCAPLEHPALGDHAHRQHKTLEGRATKPNWFP